MLAEILDVNSAKRVTTRVVQIMTVCNVWKGITEEQLKQKTFREMYKDKNFQKSFMICNYRFFRRFDNGKSTPWMIDLITHLTLDPEKEDKSQKEGDK